MRTNTKRSNALLWRRKVSPSPTPKPQVAPAPSPVRHAPSDHVFEALMHISQPQRDAARDEMRATVLGHAFPHYHSFQDHHYTRFPGPQPHGASKRSLKSIRNREYLVSEKSDGVRVMLYIRNQQPHFIDRKFNLYQVNSPLLALFSTDADTLIDGELVLCHMRDEEGEAKLDKELMFLMFDCIVLNGKNVTREMTEIRLAQLTEFDKAFAAFSRTSSYPVPFFVEKKLMMPTPSIHRVLSRISQEDDGNYIFVSVRRVSRNDGLIFTPIASTYHMKNELNIYKWKPAEMMTVDFKVISPFWDAHGNLILYDLCLQDNRAEDRPFARCRREMVGGEFERFHRQAKRECGNRHVDSFVVECSYDFQTEEWGLVKLRSDKTHGNKHTVVLDTLEKARENVTFEDVRSLFMQPSR